MKGVTTSRLLDLANQQDQRNVPIGSPYLVSNKERVSKDVRGMIDSQKLITPSLSQFIADGYDSLEVGRDVSQDGVDFNAQQERGALRIVEGSYDADTGELILIRANKEQIVMRDLLRVDQLGVGRAGPRGMPAHDGDDGFDGHDGCDGDNGCEGAKGPEGRVGPPGPEGDDGFEGEQGPTGCEGAVGQPGQVGPKGRHGYEGPRGLPGPSCDNVSEGDGEGAGKDSQGTPGAQGPAFGDGVWFGQTSEAPSSVAIVGLPDDGIASNVGVPGTGVLPNPKPAPGPPPPLPEDPPKPPEPEPAPGPGTVTLCRKINSSPRNHCDGNKSHWSVSCVIKGGAIRVGPAWGISTLCSYNNTAWWPHCLHFCGTFTRGASFSYEFTVPAGIIALFRRGCTVIHNVDGTGGTFRGTLEGSALNNMNVKMIGKTKKIPVWFALVIKNSEGKIVYYTGMNRTPYTNFPGLEGDDNWFSNTVMQTIGD